MKLSIIIPVYKVEQTLRRCVESISIADSYDYEILLVDDLSPDSSEELCDELAEKDTHIRVIHRKENGGLSAARNTGIEAATGDIITFVDSDDYLQRDTYNDVLPLAEKYDIVEFPVYRFYGSSKQAVLSFADQVYTDKESYWLGQKGYEHTYAWNKVYKRSLFDNVRFPEGKVFEDVATFPLLLQKAESIATTSKGLYYYCLNEQGITATAQGPELECLLEFHLKAMRWWCDDVYYLHVLNIQMDVCELTGKEPILPFRHIVLLSPRLSIKQRLKAIMLNFLGIKGICNLNMHIHKWIKRH